MDYKLIDEILIGIGLERLEEPEKEEKEEE